MELDHLKDTFININNYPESLINKIIKQINDEQTIMNLEEQQHQQNTLQTEDEEKMIQMTLPYAEKKGERIARE